MKTLFLDCSNGVAGDMLVAALLELQEDKHQAVDYLNALFDKRVKLSVDNVNKCGIVGTHFDVNIGGYVEGQHCHHVHEHSDTTAENVNHEHEHEHDHCAHSHDEEHHHEHHHHHSSLADITVTIDGLDIDQHIKQRAKAVYNIIAQAEGKVHGERPNKIHFHEVGEVDAIVDVVSALWLLDKLQVDRVVCTPINTGSGTVKCQHGVLPVPAPATAEILQGMQCYSDGTLTELATPTGCALIKSIVQQYGAMPAMNIEKCGYGMGTKDLPNRPNCLRAVLGESEFCADVWELSCNLDDMSGERIAYAMERIIQAGAIDVYYCDIVMKKNRPAVMLSCLVHPEDKERVEDVMLRHTSTLGVRATPFERKTLDREQGYINTPYGRVRVKFAYGKDFQKYKAEYDDLAKRALDNDVTIEEVDNEVRKKI